MAFQPFPTLSDFLLTLFIFTVIDIPMFWLFIVSVDRIIAIGSDFDPYGLLVISDSSDAISTSPRLFLLILYLPLPFYTEYHCTLFPQLRKTSHHLDLTQTAFRCVPRPHSSNSTLTHCVLPRSIAFFRLYFILTRVLSVSLWSHSIFVTYIGLHIRTYPTTYIHLSDYYWAGYTPLLSPLPHIGHIGTDYTRTSHF